MTMKLYVGNLAFQTSKRNLQRLFSQASAIESPVVLKERETRRSRDFGIVEMYVNDETEAKKVKHFLTEITESRKRARKTQTEINRLKKKTQAVLNKLL